MAAKYQIPVCPHAGGVGLCEYVQHLSAFDFVSVSTTMEDRVIEYVDHLHEHFVDPVQIRQGRYLMPQKHGYSSEIRAESLERYCFPDGEIWSADLALESAARDGAR
jgi:L-fuconate dehydratase